MNISYIHLDHNMRKLHVGYDHINNDGYRPSENNSEGKTRGKRPGENLPEGSRNGGKGRPAGHGVDEPGGSKSSKGGEGKTELYNKTVSLLVCQYNISKSILFLFYLSRVELLKNKSILVKSFFIISKV